MTLELSNFKKLPKHKPKNYSVSTDCNIILESATDISYIIWACSINLEFIVIYTNNDGTIILNAFNTNNGKFSSWITMKLCDIYFQKINFMFNETLRHDIDSILDIAVSDITDVYKCLSNAGIIDVLCDIISSYLSFTVPMRNFIQ